MEPDFNELATAAEKTIAALTDVVQAVLSDESRSIEDRGRISVDLSVLLVSLTKRYNGLMRTFNSGRAHVCAAIEDAIRQREELRRQMASVEFAELDRFVEPAAPANPPVPPQISAAQREEGWTIVRHKVSRPRCWHSIPGVSPYPVLLPGFTFRKTAPRRELLPLLRYETAKEFQASPHAVAFVDEFGAIALHPRVLGELKWAHLGDFVFPGNHETPQFVRQYDPGRNRGGPPDNTSFYVDPMQHPGARYGRCFTVPLRYVRPGDQNTDAHGALRIGAARHLMQDAAEISNEDWSYFRDFVWHLVVVYHIAELVRRHPHYTWCENCRQKYKS